MEGHVKAADFRVYFSKLFFLCDALTMNNAVYVSNLFKNKNCCISEKQPPEMFRKKFVLKSFAKFTGKHLC